MPQFQTRHPVQHSAENMFRLVADVERYPQFVPLCRDLKVTHREQIVTGHKLIATMAVGNDLFNERFTTTVLLHERHREIEATYLDGPFHHLENRWRFMEDPKKGCVVDFYISYAFRSPLLGAALGPVFDKAFRRFTKAFEDRADEIYGRPVPVIPTGA